MQYNYRASESNIVPRRLARPQTSVLPVLPVLLVLSVVSVLLVLHCIGSICWVLDHVIQPIRSMLCFGSYDRFYVELTNRILALIRASGYIGRVAGCLVWGRNYACEAEASRVTCTVYKLAEC